MNFLAHAYLSGEDSQVMTGNFIGDFVKGKKYETYPKLMQKGILLHRGIDEYTDGHPVVGQSKDRLRAKYRHYSSVIVDVVYDHLLAANWHKYHDKSLGEFTQQLYFEIDSMKNELPDRFQNIFRYMKRDNWLYQYSKIEGIEQALNGMSMRTKFDSKMDEAIHDIKANYVPFLLEFQEFMPDVIAFSKQWQEEYE